MKIFLPKQRILDFDIENRPLSYLGGDFTTGEITAIAWSFVGHAKVSCVLLGRDTPEQMLTAFREAYDASEMVTGHFIRGHDLPVINGALLECGLEPLSDKLVQDTKTDLVKRRYISASQENLAAMFGLDSDKLHMNQDMWREANRLTPKGLALTRQRVTSDVRQHKELRAKLIELGALAAPRVWSGGVPGPSVYVP